MVEQTPEEIHERIVETVRQAILRRLRAPIRKNYLYTPEKGVDLEIDMFVILNNIFCIFEIKTGTKEAKARKQLRMHQSCITNLQNDLSSEGLFFSTVRTFLVSWKEDKVVNTITNKEIHVTEFLENQIPFLLQ